MSLLAAQSTAKPGGDPIARAWANGDGRQTQAPRPFSSLEEIEEMARQSNALDDNYGAILLEVIPRLMATDLPTIQRLLAALEQGTTLKEGERRFPANAMLIRWIAQDPAGAVAFSLRRSEMFDDTMRMMGLSALAHHNAGKARELIDSLPEIERNRIAESFDRMEKVRDPSKYLNSISPVDSSDDVRTALRSWVLKDPSAAASWASSKQGERAEEMRREVGVAWAKEDNAAALAWAAALPSNERLKVERAIVESLIHDPFNDPDTLEDVLKTGPRPAVVLSALENGDSVPDKLLANFSEAELQQALGEAPDESHSTVTTAVGELIKRLGHAATAERIARLPKGHSSENALDALAEAWGKEDPEAASAWVSSLRDDLRTSAAKGLISSIHEEDPESALVWAKALPDLADRGAKEKAVYQSWLERDPVTAIASLHGMPPEQQARIFQKKDP